MPDDFLEGMEAVTEPVEESAVESEPEETKGEAEESITPESTPTEAPPTETAPTETTTAEPAKQPPMTKSPEVLYLERLAAERGVTPTELITQLSQATEQQKRFEYEQRVRTAADQLYAGLLEKHGASADESVIRELAALQANQLVRGQYEAAERDRVAAEQRQRQEREKAEQERLAPWTRFFQRYPDADPKTLESEFYLKVQGGMTPIEAKLEMELAALKSSSAKDAKKEENKEKAVGSLKGTAGQEPPDEFLSGLLG